MKMYLLILLVFVGINVNVLASSSVKTEDAISEKYAFAVKAGYHLDVAGGGGEISYLYSPDLQFSLDFFRGGYKNSSSGGGIISDVVTGEDTSYDFYSKGKIRSESIAVKARYFLYNSLNLSGGLGYQSTTVSYSHYGPRGGMEGVIDDIRNLTDTRQAHGELSYDILNLDIALGNKWSFDNGITLSADWIGMTIPVHVISEDGGSEGIEHLDFDKAEYVQEEARKPNRVRYSFLMLGAGYQF